MDEVKDRKNIALIFRINNALTKQKNKKMARYDLTSIQADVLIYIHSDKPDSLRHNRQVGGKEFYQAREKR